MDKKQIELIKEHIRQELSTADKESKKAARVFVRTLREAGLISRHTKCKLLEYIDSQWAKAEWEAEYNFKVNSKVFATVKEARDFSKDLMAHGGLGGWTETKEEVNARYLGNLETGPV